MLSILYMDFNLYKAKMKFKYCNKMYRMTQRGKIPSGEIHAKSSTLLLLTNSEWSQISKFFLKQICIIHV